MDEILNHITASEAEAILQALVRAGGVNPPGETADGIAVLRARLEAEGIPCEVLSARPRVDNLVARLRGRRPGKSLLFNGHVDVVPPGDGWTVDPFAGEVRGGRVYGRGACDMKAGVTAMMLAVLALKRAGAPFDGEILLEAVADEEMGAELGTQFLLAQGIGRGADFAIIGEPSNLRVDLGNRGIAWLEVTVKGKAGHPGRPATGINAVNYAGRLLGAVEAMHFTLRNDLFEVPEPSITATIIHGGVKANVIPDTCVLTFDRRTLPGESAGLAAEQIEQLIAERPQAGITASVRIVKAAEPYLIERSEPVVQALVQAHERIVGAAPVLGAKGGATDGAHLYHTGGIPTVLYGPGDVHLAHTADEYAEVADVVRAAKVYALTALRLLSERD
ncbi:MAG: M20 family metallopeptidase [Chloroflexota bacterium]